MGENVLVLIEQMKMFATLMLLGFMAFKIKLINDQNTDNISALLTRLILPLMIGTSIGSSNRDGIFSMGIFIIVVFFIYCMGLVLAYVSGKVLKVDKELLPVHTAAAGYSNSGFFAAPITISMFGDIAALSFAAYTTIDAIFVWIGIPYMFDKERKGAKVNWKKVFNPVVIASIIGLIILIGKIPVTDNIVWNTLSSVGSTSKYFACMYIGADIARKGFKTMVKYPKVWGAVFTKLIAYPIIAAAVLTALSVLDTTMFTILIIYCSSPTIVTITMLAKQAGVNDEYATASVIISSMISLFTIPFVMWLVTSVLF